MGLTAERTILAAEAAALTLAVYGDISGQNGQGKMPRPKVLVATMFLFGALGWVAEFGQQAGRVAAAIAVTLLLTLLVGTGAQKSGAAGRNLIHLLHDLTTKLAPSGGNQ